MKVIEFDSAIGSLEELFETSKKRKIAELEYVAALRFTEVPTDSKLLKQHLEYYTYYSGQVVGIQNALTQLARLGFELEEENTVDCKMCGGDGERFYHEPKKCGYCDGTGKANAPQE